AKSDAECPLYSRKRTFIRAIWDVRFVPKADMAEQRPLADSRVVFSAVALTGRDELAPFHSITSSARASRVGGTTSPNVLAVCRLMTSSNLVARRTGRSAGLSPLRMRPL